MLSGLLSRPYIYIPFLEQPCYPSHPSLADVSIIHTPRYRTGMGTETAEVYVPLFT